MSAANDALLAVETELDRQTAELSGPMADICRYATEGGRRTRARLLLGATQQAGPRAVLAATALEMMHAATLLQDDIFDAGEVRRGRPTAHLCFGKALTILASDWLLIRALELAADVDPHFFRCLARAGTAMAQAEARELTPTSLRSLCDAQNYGTVIARGKTAALFGTALCGAAVLEGLRADVRFRWEQIGLEMGLTYQLADDCVDRYGEENAAGKSLGHDLVAGCLTMPVLLAARLLEKGGAPVSLQDLQAGHLPAADLLRLGTAMRSADVMAQLHDLLQRRLAGHRSEAAEAGLSPKAVESWQEDLLARLDPCFSNALVRESDPSAFAPGTAHLRTAWSTHA